MPRKCYYVLNKRLLAFGVILMIGRFAFSQSSLTLPDFYQALVSQHPYREISTLAKSIEFNQKKINGLSLLPQSSFLGQATWQSDVTEIPLILPGLDIPGQAHDQYRATLEIVQALYDGGSRKAMDEQTVRLTEVETANGDVLMYNLKETVCRTYYTAVMADLSMRQLILLLKDLDQKSGKLKNQIKEGIVSGYQSAALQIKIKETHQSISEARKHKLNAYKSLELLTGMKMDTSSRLSALEMQENNATVERPELILFDAQKKLQASQFHLAQTRYQPKVQVFGQLGYGRPGLNLLSADFKPYSILGLRWQWNLNNLYTKQSTREKNMLQSNMDKIKIQEDAFRIQQNIREQAQLQEIEHLNELISDDEEVIGLHERVVKSSEAQLENGVITINEYAADTDNLTQAKIKRDMHLALRLQSKELLNLIHGKN